jgi:hypothetical protein
VRWRTGRHREALWKSLVLPAGGVALCWLLLMTLWLPLLDYARSNRPLVRGWRAHVPAGACVPAPGLPPPLVAALEHFGRWRGGRPAPGAARLPACEPGARGPAVRGPPHPEGWELVAECAGPPTATNVTVVYRRRGP